MQPNYTFPILHSPLCSLFQYTVVSNSFFIFITALNDCIFTTFLTVWGETMWTLMMLMCWVTWTALAAVPVLILVWVDWILVRKRLYRRNLSIMRVFLKDSGHHRAPKNKSGGNMTCMESMPAWRTCKVSLAKLGESGKGVGWHRGRCVLEVHWKYAQRVGSSYQGQGSYTKLWILYFLFFDTQLK